MNDGHRKQGRTESLAKFKRQHILAAARRIFDADGTDGLNMRAIAEEAGYSLGAAYNYFRTKEEIEIELLAGILGDLTRHIRVALQQDVATDNQGARAFSIFASHFRDHPEERRLLLLSLADLGETSGDVPAPARKELDSRLLNLMGLLANELHQRTPASAAEAQEETTDFTASLLGMMLLESGGRLQLLNQDSQEMVDRHSKRMLLRVAQQEDQQ
ncbi:TetR/AcrR family transcriptional regulator [Sneathiella sp.]|uniref:TetR/AcrR family transcriptional regulator n=1 Tax=Sneathiella sp. TaxID=1964365 RepID=UPI002613EEB0|nr:TetR/AcrR family transcriptional regulator [Sneathiella sp.]MDF2365679.1 helix-turn-helix domain containing protein [Sneathiella sp.]